jgi:response regulator of citrate/malate metabolism
MLDEIPSVIQDHVETLQQAQAQLRSATYDVVITEAYLTDGNWLDLMHIVRKSVIEPKVILTHALGDEKLRSEALSYGVYDVIVEPCDSREVLRLLADACSRETWMHLGR